MSFFAVKNKLSSATSSLKPLNRRKEFSGFLNVKGLLKPWISWMQNFPEKPFLHTQIPTSSRGFC